MAETTKIKWAHHTWNPWRGCSKCAVGCQNCYATRRGGARYFGSNPRLATAESGWKLLHKYNRAAEKAGERRRIFPSMCDPFEDAMTIVDGKGNTLGTTEKPRSFMFRLIGDTPWLDWLLLTKRPENIMSMVPEHWQQGGTPSNVWYGTSVSTQEDADRNIPRLIEAGANGVRLFVSCEPLIEPITLERRWLYPHFDDHPGLNWVIVGGESGHKARPCNVEWIRSILKQCGQVRVPCFVKQLGTNVFGARGTGAVTRQWYTFKNPKGADPVEWPEDLRVQEITE